MTTKDIKAKADNLLSSYEELLVHDVNEENWSSVDSLLSQMSGAFCMAQHLGCLTKEEAESRRNAAYELYVAARYPEAV